MSNKLLEAVAARLRGALLSKRQAGPFGFLCFSFWEGKHAEEDDPTPPDAGAVRLASGRTAVLTDMTGDGSDGAVPVVHGTEASGGRLGAVLRLSGRPGPVALGRFGPWVTTTLAQAREVLTDPVRFDFPTDVSRESVRRGRASSTPQRSPHPITPPLTPEAVARGTDVFLAELAGATEHLGTRGELDAMQFMRIPVARSTTAALLPDLSMDERNKVAGLVLAWIDALAPVIGSRSNGLRWSRRRRAERAARTALHAALAAHGDPDPAVAATVLAAGIQVPIAAGAWLLCELASLPGVAEELRADESLASGVAWETVRLCPPTWVTARVATAATSVEGVDIPEGHLMMVSPLLLGREPALVPGPDASQPPLDEFAPARWQQPIVRPGAWLPFGAGPHTCPGRNLGLAQLMVLAGWSRRMRIVPVEQVCVDQSRGLFPNPAVLKFECL